MMTQILTPFECGSMTKLFSKDRANKYFSKGMVVFFAGGTGHPYFSTDTGVALRAIEMDADCILLASRRSTASMTAIRRSTRMQRSMIRSRFRR